MIEEPQSPAGPTIDWLGLHHRGWSIFPLKPRSKEPVGPWKRFQTEHATAEEIAQWATTDCNVGIVTGAISGIVVLDLDSADAIAEAEALGFIGTDTVQTSRGLHAYFAHPGGEVRNLAKFRPGMDLRGDGGYVVGPGSVHPDGSIYSPLEYWL